ncbi:MAG TPA: HAD hydrolase-like protein [Nannocystaceae bacterium]|nr:HAD hydrolase-like protein [Nannocystaceae bacterium]
MFDIDGTLIDGGGSGRAAMELAFAEIVGDDTALPRVRFSGMTDPGIVRAGLRLLGGDPEHDAGIIARVLEHYLARLPAVIAASPRFAVHKGVRARLAELATRDRVAIGLGTGNLEPGARLKLTPIELVDAFAFGGYGSDHEDRAELLAIGADRGAATLGCARADCRVVIIGDTPKDVAAAQAIGAESIAVATGLFTVDELRETGATMVVPDLEHDDARSFLA